LVTKSSVQLSPGPSAQNMFSLEQDYTGADFTASIKGMNPNILEGGLTGIFIGDYLQSITPSLSLGLNAMWQRAAMNQGPETLVSYAARYKTREWVASARLVAAGGLQCSYWRRLADRVEAGVDVNLQFQPGLNPMGMMSGMKKEGTTTLGVRYDFRMSSFRAQIDSQGRLGCLLEKRVAPPVTVSFFGEIDHVKVSFAIVSKSKYD
jgi:mitochondrial import receptor subunit TOM40